MKLRKLEKRDAPLMLEWMHDESVVHYLAADFQSKTIQDCDDFISSAAIEIEKLSAGEVPDNIHFAITDDNDIYMGTVSLKNIDPKRQRSEFAITIRKSAMGSGFSQYGMKKIIQLGFTIPVLRLTTIYWCVDKKNIRAIHFYDKQGYERIEADQDMIQKYNKGCTELIWYSVKKNFQII